MELAISDFGDLGRRVMLVGRLDTMHHLLLTAKTVARNYRTLVLLNPNPLVGDVLTISRPSYRSSTASKERRPHSPSSLSDLGDH